MAEADAQVAEEHRLADEARAWNTAHGNAFRPRGLGHLMEQVIYDSGALIAIDSGNDTVVPPSPEQDDRAETISWCLRR